MQISDFYPIWPCNLMDDLKNWRATLPCYIKLCASFCNQRWIQTRVRVWKRQIQFKIGNFVSCVTLKLDGWPSKTIGHLFYATSNFVLRTSFHSHQWIQTRVTLQKHPVCVKIGHFFVPCDLQIWQMTLKTNRATALCSFKLCASFHSHR